MKKRISKIMAMLLTCAVLATSVSLPSSAESGVDVSFKGMNVTAKGTNIGEGAATAEEDYVLELDVKDGYAITNMEVEAVSTNLEYSPLTYIYDETTQTITVSWSDNSDVLETATEINIKAKAAKGFDEASDVITVTELPFTEEFSFSEDMIMNLDENDDLSEYATKVYQVELSEGDTFYAECVGTGDYMTDTMILFGRYGESGEYIDEDMYGYGEFCLENIESDGEYFVAFMCNDNNIGETVSVEILTRNEDESLDFTEDTVPVPDADDLWSWDADTKTLTLNDGFELLSNEVAITLPDDSTVIVKGNASIDAITEGIRSTGSVDILLDAGARLNIESKYDSIASYNNIVVYSADASDKETMTIKGTAGENGELPEIIVSSAYGIVMDSRNVVIENCKLEISAAFDAIYAYDSTVDIKNSDISTVSGYGISVFKGELNIEESTINFDCSYEGMYIEDAPVNITDSDVKMVCAGECVYSDRYNEDTIDDDSYNTDLTVKNSTLDLKAEQEVIQLYYDDVVIENSKSVMVSTEEEGIYVGDGGSIIITGGSIDIKAEENALEISDEGKITLEDVNFSIATLGDDYRIIALGDTTTDFSYFSLPGSFIMVDKVNNSTYEGEWNGGFVSEDGYIEFKNENEAVCEPTYIISTFDGDKSDNMVVGVESEYNQGDKIAFTAVGGGEDELYPIWGFTRWNALNWEIADTELSGSINNDNSGEIDTSSLEAGTYTLKVNFQQQSYSYKSWGYYTNPTDKHKDSVEIEFTVVASEEETPDEEIPDEGDEEVTPDNKGDEEVTPDNKGDEEVTPDDGDENPNTSADSKALTAVAVTLAVLFALVGNTKRKRTLNKR